MNYNSLVAIYCNREKAHHIELCSVFVQVGVSIVFKVASLERRTNLSLTHKMEYDEFTINQGWTVGDPS